MSSPLPISAPAEPASGTGALFAEIAALRAGISATAVSHLGGWGVDPANADPGVVNLARYVALRRHDLRALQRRLMVRGLSSLGRLESRVAETLDAVQVALGSLAGLDPGCAAPSEEAFFAGEARLARHADALFGESPAGRRSRIMVTLPGEAAGDPGFVIDLARRGMDIARINCAHDGPIAWRAMASHVRTASDLVGRRLTVLMDIAGPKIRTEAVATPDKKARIEAGALLRLCAAGVPRPDETTPFAATVSLPELVTRLSAGDRVLYDDGKLQGRVESLSPGEALVRVDRTKTGGTKLKPEKGLNLPDTALGLSPLTAKDHADLDAVIDCADMVGYSFVSQPDDLDLLEAALAGRRSDTRPLGVVAKIERPEAVANLPRLIARAAGRRPFAVMIARGDLAAEIGFERLAEMQEEILWLCEAAHVPAIWATQVLEDLVKTGIPSRGEMTDAAMAARAECVMLNKGPEIGAAVSVLDGLLQRMEGHILKKTPTLRALRSW